MTKIPLRLKEGQPTPQTQNMAETPKYPRQLQMNQIPHRHKKCPLYTLSQKVTKIP